MGLHIPCQRHTGARAQPKHVSPCSVWRLDAGGRKLAAVGVFTTDQDSFPKSPVFNTSQCPTREGLWPSVDEPTTDGGLGRGF